MLGSPSIPQPLLSHLDHRHPANQPGQLLRSGGRFAILGRTEPARERCLMLQLTGFDDDHVQRMLALSVAAQIPAAVARLRACGEGLIERSACRRR